jgi:phage tail-like protein
MSELSVEAAKVEYYEGGALIPDKSPGRLTFADVTLERGATRDLELHLWFVQVARAAANAGLVAPLYKRSLDLVQLDRDGSTLRRWTLHNAWPVKYVAGEWDADSDEVVIESVTLTYDYFDPKLV